MKTRFRSTLAGAAAAALVAAGLFVAQPAQASGYIIDVGATVTFTNNCTHRVGVSISKDWEAGSAVNPIDEYFILGVGERRHFNNLQPTEADGTMYAMTYHVAADGNGSAIIRQGVLRETYAAQMWFICGIPGLSFK